MKFILGTKLNMTQIWRKEDEVVAVTAIQAGPCVITQVKTEEDDGYFAVQVGFGEKKEKNIKKPQQGHLKGLGNFQFLREFRITKEEALALKRGDIVQVDTFSEGDKIKVTGTSKGRGFQGVVKRHGFAGAPKSHGTKDQLRMPGSIGATGPAHVFKGVKMAGRMGGDRVTVTNLEVVKIDTENNILYIKGAVPGSRGSLVLIIGEGELKVKEAQKEDLKEDKVLKEAKKEEKDKEATKEEDKKVEENDKEKNTESKEENSKENKNAKPEETSENK